MLDVNSYFQEIPETQETNNTGDIVNTEDDTVVNTEDTADEKSVVIETEQKISESGENKDKLSSEAEESEEESE